MVGRGVAAFDPPERGGEQNHPGLRPAPDAPRLGVGVIGGQGLGGECMHQVWFFGLEDRTFAHRRGFDLHECGKARAVVAQMHTIAIDPAMIRAFAPGSIGVEMMQPGRDTARLAVGLVPDGALGFEQTLIFVELATVKGGVQVFGVLREKSHKVLEDRIEGFITPRQGGAVWHSGQAQDLPIVQMLCQPTVLGFEVENLSEGHQGKEHNQPLMLIHEGMATMGASALGLYKAIKQGPKKIDIVGEGWQSHQGTSWEMGVFPQRRPDLPTMSSLNAFVHTPQISAEGSVIDRRVAERRFVLSVGSPRTCVKTSRPTTNTTLISGLSFRVGYA